MDIKKVRMGKIYCTILQCIKNLKTLKYHICDKTLLSSSNCDKCRSEDEKIFKLEESILDLISNI